jgi:glycosyltransferase involved in cell wall biosynthesis
MPMEPIEQRYSKQWLKYFELVFKENTINYNVISGESIQSNLSSKFFLDPVNTNIWKLTQLSNLLKNYNNIQNNDIVFFMDLWNPGLEVLPYTKALLNKNIRIMGYLHAGSYDSWDLTNQTGMTVWAKGLEESWLSCCEKIFVATQFHKDLVTQQRLVPKVSVKVVGFPLDINSLVSKYANCTKENFVVFTGRKSVEKGYQKVLKLKKQNNNIVITLDQERTKEQYYNLLGKAKVVLAPSEQETFGIGVVEGMACGCIPVVPDKLSFKETVPSKWRYDPIKENIQDYINKAMISTRDDRINIQKYVERFQYQTVINNICMEF